MATVKKYQGKDRRMINKLAAVLSAIQVRDTKALDTTKKTQALSTRSPIIDLTDSAQLAAITTLNLRINTVLAATKPA